MSIATYSQRGSQRVLGIDPGSQITGFGIVEDHGDHLQTCISGTIRTMGGLPTRSNDESATDGTSNLPRRLHIIYQGLCDIIRQYQPQVMAVESVFHSTNAQSALKLGHARGVALLAAAEFKLHFFEYAPRAIKKGLTGSGAAPKEQVQKMVRLLLHGATLPRSLDASDALAVAIYHCHLNPWLQKTKRYTKPSISAR